MDEFSNITNPIAATLEIFNFLYQNNKLHCLPEVIECLRHGGRTVNDEYNFLIDGGYFFIIDRLARK